MAKPAVRSSVEDLKPSIDLNLKGKIMKFIKNFMQEEDGVTAIEYGLIAALIAVVIIASVTSVGDELVLVFTEVQSELATALAKNP